MRATDPQSSKLSDQRFIERLAEFSHAATALSVAWEHLSADSPLEGHDFEGTYPFAKSFDELILDISEWSFKAEEMLRRNQPARLEVTGYGLPVEIPGLKPSDRSCPQCSGPMLCVETSSSFVCRRCDTEFRLAIDDNDKAGDFPVDSADWFEEIAKDLREQGFDANAEHTGGGIICITVAVGEYCLFFGTANENWGFDVYKGDDFDEDLTHAMGANPVMQMTLSSETQDPRTCANAIATAAQIFSREVASGN